MYSVMWKSKQSSRYHARLCTSWPGLEFRRSRDFSFLCSRIYISGVDAVITLMPHEAKMSRYEPVEIFAHSWKNITLVPTYDEYRRTTHKNCDIPSYRYHKETTIYLYIYLISIHPNPYRLRYRRHKRRAAIPNRRRKAEDHQYIATRDKETHYCWYILWM